MSVPLNKNFVIVNKTSKLPEGWPNLSGFTTEMQILQWIDDMMNNGGMGPDQELVAMHEPFARPQADERLFDIIETNQYAAITHPVYSMLKQWAKTYSEPTLKDVPTQKMAVDIKENDATESTIPYHQRLKTTVLAMRSLLKYLSLSTNDQINAVSSSILTAKDKKRLRLFRAIALKIHNNDTERDNKHAQIDAVQTPNLEENWEIDNFTEDV